jgi:hypothetical protein
MLKERASGMYRLSAFYAARTLSDLPMDFTLPTVGAWRGPRCSVCVCVCGWGWGGGCQGCEAR